MRQKKEGEKFVENLVLKNKTHNKTPEHYIKIKAMETT